MKQKILDILQKLPHKYFPLKKLFKQFDNELYNIIENSYLETENFSEKIYRILNDITESPKCYCGNTIKDFVDFTRGYSTFCCKKCAKDSTEVRNKRAKTNIEKYGSACPLGNKDVKQKSIETLRKNYNDDTLINPGQLGLSKLTIQKGWYDNLVLDSTRNGECLPLFSFDEYVKNGRTYTEYKFKCLKCNHEFLDYLVNGHVPKCDNCNKPLVLSSRYEDELIQFIREFYDGKLLKSNRSLLKTLELDIYLPEKNFAIEFDGIYWHSELAGKDKNYHLNKTNLCKDNDVQLIHIFENEWNIKKDICKSIIKSKLGFSDKIFARKCTIKEIDGVTKKNFLQENHIQGNDNSLIGIGLFYNDELVSIMTFGKSRYNSNYEYEIFRFCNKKYTNIVGGASKLLSYFEKTYSPKSLITYADIRYSNGNLYKQLGMEELKQSDPNYFYVTSKEHYEILHSRLEFQKHKLADKLHNYSESLTEFQNMKLNGWTRIWDCGNLVFSKKYNL